MLGYMKKGKPITNNEAFWLFSITRLGDVIFRLRDKGHVINTELVKNQANNQSHGKYTLIKEKADVS